MNLNRVNLKSMSLENLKRRLERRDKWERLTSGQTWHRKGYHRFFEGYTEYRVREGNKKKRKLVYTADYHVCDLKPGSRLLIRLLYSILSVCAVLLFFRAGLRPVLSNYDLAVNLMQAIVLASQVRVVIALGHYIVYGGKMEIRQYKSSVKALTESTSLAAVLTAAGAGIVFLRSLFSDLAGLKGELVSVLMLLASALLLYLIHLIEKRITYSTVENKTVIDENAEDVYLIKGA